MITLFKDLVFRPHSLGRGAVHAKMDFPNGKWVSVVGGEYMYGDGVTTFEVMDSDHPHGVEGYLSKKDVNDILISLQIDENTVQPKYKIENHKLT